MFKHVTCCKCGCSSEKFFEVKIERNDKDVPCSFTVTKGLFDFGGSGTPDGMVMNTLRRGFIFPGKKNAGKRGYYISVGLFLAEHMKEYLSPYVCGQVLKLSGGPVEKSFNSKRHYSH